MSYDVRPGWPGGKRAAVAPGPMTCPSVASRAPTGSHTARTSCARRRRRGIPGCGRRPESDTARRLPGRASTCRRCSGCSPAPGSTPPRSSIARTGSVSVPYPPARRHRPGHRRHAVRHQGRRRTRRDGRDDRRRRRLDDKGRRPVARVVGGDRAAVARVGPNLILPEVRRGGHPAIRVAGAPVLRPDSTPPRSWSARTGRSACRSRPSPSPSRSPPSPHPA